MQSMINKLNNNHQKTAQKAVLVSLVGSLIGWIDTLEEKNSKRRAICKVPQYLLLQYLIMDVDSPGVEPGRLGVSTQPSEPAEPTPPEV